MIMRKLFYIFVSLCFLSTSSLYASENDGTVFDEIYKPSPECRKYLDSIYEQFAVKVDYNPKIDALLYSLNTDYIDDHYCFMPLTIIGFGYLNKLHQHKKHKIDMGYLDQYSKLLLRIGFETNKYICADKRLFTIKDRLLVPDYYLDKSRCNQFK